MNNYFQLLNLAKEASNYAYAPYSNFKVGAAVLFESKNIYSGCNVENSSYGLSLCAERNAISNGISNGEHKIEKIAIFSPNTYLCFPCGACRQWIMELSKDKNTEIILQDDSKDGIKIFSIDQLLPFAFSL